MKAVLEALKELIHWMRIEAEIRSRRLILTELEKVEGEIDGIEDEISEARKHGDHANADRMLLSIARRASFERGIFDLAKRADIHCACRHDFGGHQCGQGQGSADSEINGSAYEAVGE